jgi:DNA-binding response OmpR family regulator
MGNGILVVDDEELILDVIKDSLELGGYESWTASNGEEAMRLFHENDPDLVITDARMPGMDGYELSRLIRRESSVPIMMLTGVVPQTDDSEGAKAVNGYLRKPIQIGDLLAKVEEMMNRAATA